MGIMIRLEMSTDFNPVIALFGAILLFGPDVRAQVCPVEVKILLPSSTTQVVISSLGFIGESAGQVYFFDTAARDLLMQGVVVRLRQGAKNDLTVKVRPPKGNQQADRSQLSQRFPCEIDRTQAGAITSYAVRRSYKAAGALEIGSEIFSAFSASQQKLLHDAGVSIDWAQVKRIAAIKSSIWMTRADSSTGKLALELWQWPAGKILEISAKAAPGADAVKYAELERLLKTNGLAVSVIQDTKTNLALETPVDRVSSIR
jgi:hypothetical protein